MYRTIRIVSACFFTYKKLLDNDTRAYEYRYERKSPYVTDFPAAPFDVSTLEAPPLILACPSKSIAETCPYSHPWHPFQSPQNSPLGHCRRTSGQPTERAMRQGTRKHHHQGDRS
ncbi:hypothetical protein COP1_043576 [Malus domestica]